MDDKNSMKALAAQDVVYSSGRIAQEYKRNKYGGHEQLISELTAALVWGFGVPLSKQLYDAVVPRLSGGKILYPWMEMSLVPGALPKADKKSADGAAKGEAFDRDAAQVLDEAIVKACFKDVSRLPLEGETPSAKRPPVHDPFGFEMRRRHLLDLVAGKGLNTSILEHYRRSNFLKLLLCTTLPMLALGTLIPLALHRLTPWLIKRDQEKERQKAAQSPQALVPSAPVASPGQPMSPTPTTTPPRAAVPPIAHLPLPRAGSFQTAPSPPRPGLASGFPVPSPVGVATGLANGSTASAGPLGPPISPAAPPVPSVPGMAPLPVNPGSPRFASSIPAELALKSAGSALPASGKAATSHPTGLLARLSPLIATFLANDTLSTLVFVDSPLSLGRVLTTRTSLEQHEVALREVCLILVLFWLQRVVQERIAKAFDKHFDAHSDIEINALRNLYTKYADQPPKTFQGVYRNLKETLALIEKSHTDPEHEKALVDSIRRYFSDHRDKAGASNLVFDLAEASGKIHTLGRQGKKYVDEEGRGIHYIDLSRRIDTDGVRDLAGYLKHLNHRMTEGHSLKAMLAKNAGLKMAAFTMSAAVCWGIVSYLVPKAQHYLTYLSTGKDEFPGIQGLT
jgi:hypothetical protein